MRPCYWIVSWGDRKRDEDGEGFPESGPQTSHHAIRISSNKYASPEGACKETFGCVADSMWVRNVGSSVAVLRVDKRRIALCNPDTGLWRRMNFNSGINTPPQPPVYWVEGVFMDQIPAVLEQQS